MQRVAPVSLRHVHLARVGRLEKQLVGRDLTARRTRAGAAFPRVVHSRGARRLGEDSFARENGFRTGEVRVDPAAWRGCLLDAWRWVLRRAEGAFREGNSRGVGRGVQRAAPGSVDSP